MCGMKMSMSGIINVLRFNLGPVYFYDVPSIAPTSFRSLGHAYLILHFISSVIQFDKFFHPVVLHDNYLICILMNINEI